MISLRSKITSKILGYYFINKNESHYVNELAKILVVDPGNLFRKLKELEKEGLFFSEMRGNQRYFGLNKKYPLLSEYKNIYESKFGLPEILGVELKKVAGLQEAYIFGSYAKGDFSSDSDIDLLLVGSHDYSKISGIVAPLERRFRREINICN